MQSADLKPLGADQAWFWEKDWQAGEREVSDELARGEGTVYGSAKEMFSALGVEEGEDE